MKLFLIVKILLLLSTVINAKTELKDGKYSWFEGGSQADLTVTKEKGKSYHIEGNCNYGVGKKYGPNMGDLDFSAPLKNGKIIYKYNDYIFTLTVNKDGSFDVNDNANTGIFGVNARFYGHFTSDDIPSFSCNKASTFIEKAICNNVQVSRLDKRMAREYTMYMSAFSFDKNRKTLERKLDKEQIAWMKERNKCEFSKTYKSCLVSSYKRRIKAIDKEFISFWKYDD